MLQYLSLLTTLMPVIAGKRVDDVTVEEISAVSSQFLPRDINNFVVAAKNVAKRQGIDSVDSLFKATHLFPEIASEASRLEKEQSNTFSFL